MNHPGLKAASRLALSGVFLCLFACAAPEAPVYPDKRDLLHYLDRRGKPHPIESRTHWDVRRIHTLQNMQKVMGSLPRLPDDPLEVQVLETERLPQVERRKITFVSQVVEGKPDRVPAYLLIPDGLAEGRSAPAVLCLHQTTAIGKAEPAGLGSNSDLHYALELARRGYVTLAPDYPGFGDYEIDPYAMGYASATMKGILNHRRAVDLLQSLPQVDPDRIGVIGHSLGGHNALFLSAFETRVGAVATSCGFNAFRHYYGGNLKGWSHRGYMPRIARLYGSDAARMPFDFTEVLGVLAPRPVFISAPAGDHNFAVAGVRECIEAALPVYERLFHSPDRLVARHPEAGHEFPAAVRQEAYEFFDRWLSHSPPLEDSMHRRDLLRTAPFLLAGSLGSPLAAGPGRPTTKGASRMRTAICAYSFRTPLGSKALTYADLVHMAVEQEIDGLDLTVYWFPGTGDDFLLPLKRLAYRNAVEIYSISIRTDLCRPTPREQARELEEIRKWIEVAHRLGAGHIRIFGGEAPPGASLEQAADWAVSVLSRAAEESGKRGVILGLENHGGITARAETMIAILERVDSPWVGINLDTGNFLQDPYGQIEACAPYAVNVQVKTRVTGPGGDPVAADWGRILRTLSAAGYKGYLALEYEGEEDPVIAVPRYLRELKALAARYGA